MLDNLVEENNLEIYESNSNEICYNVKKNTHVIEDQDIDTDTESLTAGTPIHFHSDTPRKKSSKKNPDIRELFTDNKMDSLHKKDTRHDNFHICHQLNLQQKEYIKFQNITIDHLRGELESKQQIIENLLDTLNHCLHSQSTKHDERYFSLQDTNFKFDQKNINNSDIPINSHKEIIPIAKERINDNNENSNTQKGNQKSTKDEITSDAINKISSSINQNSSATSEQNITESGHNNKSTTKKKDTKDREIADKAGSNNISKESKSAKKKVFILGDSIIKHVISYSLSKSLDNCKVYLKDFAGV